MILFLKNMLRNEEKTKKNVENCNRVVCNITENFVFLDRRVLNFNVT